jgi:hypothetical protein
MANTAFTNTLESEVLNSTLRGAAFTAKGGTALYLAFLTNSTNDGTIAELAAGGSYTGTGRPAFVGTAGQQFTAGAAGSNTASTGGASLYNANAITFTATATHTGIVGIAICTGNTVGSSLESTALYYGDLTGGSVTLTAGQSITFAALAIQVSLD